MILKRFGMNYKINVAILAVLIAGIFNIYCQTTKAKTFMDKAKKYHIQIILGSTRKNRLSDKIGNKLKQFADKRPDISTEIIDLRDFNLPFFNEEVPPSRRKEITDPVIKRWSNKVMEADAFVIVCPVYNASYSAVLKNALDSLYPEWNNKPVAFVGYSGGLSGGTNAINHLREVVLELKMKPISSDIKIPSCWKAFDQEGNFADKTIEAKFNSMIDQLIK